MSELKELCFECESHDCQFNHGGECRFALVHERKPNITDEDGCTDYDYREKCETGIVEELGPKQMRDTDAIPRMERTAQGDGTVCYFFGDTCIRARERMCNGKFVLEPVAGDQVACGEWAEVPADTVKRYCTILEQHLNKEG